MEKNKLFRKAALEKLASPERLDVLMRVTSPVGWLGLGTIGFVLASVVLWSIFGSMPERIDGQGILMSGGGLREIKANGEGLLSKMSVRVNDSVTAGQVIGELAQGKNDDARAAAELKFAEAQREYNMGRLEDQSVIDGLRGTIALNASDVERTKIDLERSQAEQARLEEQLAKGYTTRARVQTAERDVSSLRQKISGLRQTMTSLNAQIATVQQKIRQRALNVEAARMELGNTTRSIERTTQITAPVAGRVIEVNKSVGDRLRPGDTLARVEPPSSGLEAVVFVDSGTGKRITAGKIAQISPVNVKREEFGFMEGRVQSVSDFPVTPEAAMNIVANSTLVQEFIGSTTKLEMRAALESDANTMSGYRWSSSRGPGFKISSGTRVNVSVIVDQKRPISQVLPILKRTIGAG